MTGMTAIDTILAATKKRLCTIYGPNLRTLILYGSWARGTGTEKSDIDLLVVLESMGTPGREIDRMIDAITDLNLEYNTVISVYPISYNEYLAAASPLLMNVRNEGVAV